MNKDPKTVTGEIIAEARKKKGYTQETLAEALGVTRQAVSRWESGSAYPETENLVRLAKLLDLDLNYLLKGEQSETPPANTAERSNVRFMFPLPFGMYRYEYKSKRTLFGLPLVHINVGYGVYRAKGVIAIGNIATGIVSIGIIAVGLLSIGDASTLTLEDSSIVVHGPGYSLSDIGSLILNGCVTLDLRSEMREVGSIESNVRSNGQYIPATPDDCGTEGGNGIILADGLVLDFIRDGVYGSVAGYTLLQPAKLEMSVVLARGSTDSSGGFAVEIAEGKVETVPHTDGDGVRAWAYTLTLELDDIPLDVIVIAVSEDDLADPIPVSPGHMVEGETFVSADGAIEATYADGAIRITGLSEGTGAIGLVSDGWKFLIVISVASPEDVMSVLALRSDDDYSLSGELAGNDLETRRI